VSLGGGWQYGLSPEGFIADRGSAGGMLRNEPMIFKLFI
jgi:hypothetical protein